MALNELLREKVRKRASFACEFCGVTETDCGGRLTIDHYRPKAKGGSDNQANLIYCCSRCNLFKHDYWPGHASDPGIWNPRKEPFSSHLLEKEDGHLQALTSCGSFTIGRLRLNRARLVAHRVAKRHREERAHQLQRYRDYIEIQEQVQAHLITVLKEQQTLLGEQRALLNLLVDNG